jgi:hypothetical protein
VDAGVGPPGRMRHHPVAAETFEDPLEFRLDRPAFALALPADEATAVEVHQSEEGLKHRAGI